MGLLYTRSIQLAIENCFLCDAICLLVYFHRAEEASEEAGVGLTRVSSCPLEIIVYHLRFRPPWCDSLRLRKAGQSLPLGLG